ncbi:hypothetical protein E6Q11_03790 [Candidatus Dojkabacteria bacterium]|uniref:Phage head morphogenesis domain-containing protein n=1 Tax=Candidatus Dojkabacteria bacterium TaxID=2099670 RepID=A0A5C7J6T4_9BACT|nr:MAG: hypothetical protein E6Q11_03790 [Candidatus Dojkabacteria bacterium]
MKNIPTIKSSAQARLLLYRLFSSKLNNAEQKLIDAHPGLWEQIISGLEMLTDAENKSDQTILNQAFASIDRITRDGLQKQFERLTGQSLWLGIHATKLLEDFVKEHLLLIKSVQHEHLNKIGFAITRGIRDGLLAKDIVKDIRQTTNISKQRARLIARNAPQQYSGALTKHHQVSAGIKKYRWQTSRDERVRKSHRKFDGEILSWDSSKPHPRSEVNCRCDAVPVLDL